MSTDPDTHQPAPRLSGQDSAAPEAWAPRAVVRLLPIAVLLLSADRYFRAAATMLLSRRGCSVLSAADEREALEGTRLHPVDVLVVELDRSAGEELGRARTLAERIDAEAAAAGRRVATVGIVVVAEASGLDEVDADDGTSHPALDKWGPFGELYEAIADRDRARRLPHTTGQAWPESVRRPGAV